MDETILFCILIGSLDATFIVAIGWELCGGFS